MKIGSNYLGDGCCEFTVWAPAHEEVAVPALKKLDKQNLEASVIEEDKLIFLHRWSQNSQIFCGMNFNNKDASFKATPPINNWQKILDSSESKWMGSGSTLPDKVMQEQVLTIKPQSFALYQQ